MTQPVRHIILPGTGAELLRRELALGFAACACRVSHLHPEALADLNEKSADLLADGGPALLFSVNFQGLYPLRERLDLLRRFGVRAAVWFVDNPWNILSGVRDPRWKSLPLFVSDQSFIEPLRAHGAGQVFHLPLAASFELFAPNKVRDAAFAPPADAAPLCFVGRSAFPGKELFFKGLTLPGELAGQIPALLSEGCRPDLLWWEKRLGLEQTAFWPGKKSRLAALGAEESNLAWRARCLERAAVAGSGLLRAASHLPGLDIYGDDGWAALLPAGARLRPPVDYYSRLPGIYAAAPYCLCLTSLQLPKGLNQRHFDVWAAGGFALFDKTPGLDIFPADLVRPLSFGRAQELPDLVEKLEKSNGRAALQRQWRNCLIDAHTYAHRARTVLELRL